VVGSGRLDLNLLWLGHKWFEQGVTEEVDRLLVHEHSGDRLSSDYHDALCKLGAGLKRLALERPEAMKYFLRCWFAVRCGPHVSPIPTANLRLVNGAYALGAGKTYHPLDAVLVGVATSVDWRQDVATALGVGAQWVSGFFDGFAQEPASSADGEYSQGYLTAEQLRTARHQRDLPDRR
jgi:hypothetical protein